MSMIEDLLRDIDILRSQLEHLINEKNENLIDGEVIAASRILNAALNQYNYNRLIQEKIRK